MECKPPRCQCKNGFVRNSQGKCVARNSCPKCGKNQVWRQCSGCEGSCKNPFPICTADCKPPRCQCQLGFVRDKNGECVAVESCPLA
ncbi:hypothetical protein L596_013909 [Steinernema carpocapsae]|uniref:TIL domain-containing protein n=1 Tax=Steinernema carpocapsae TaxID=34508 RepID=A0A4U5P1J8_STECR|nr:hypothetical protein L596_013909 [Steinernema carpocapsae]